MSAQQVFAYCFDCRELNYGISDKNGVYTRDSASSNHFNCPHVHCFGSPDSYTPPIRQVLAKLQAGLEVTHDEIVLFKLAITLGDLDPCTGAGESLQQPLVGVA
ncbi:MAG: hypothetical protein LBN10_05180 [Propionibacteriaceae bacterium]|jgi:hypothetical protein|nr:hypothetical protein [Propionibacteriaceae bacterium]